MLFSSFNAPFLPNKNLVYICVYLTYQLEAMKPVRIISNYEPTKQLGGSVCCSTHSCYSRNKAGRSKTLFYSVVQQSLCYLHYSLMSKVRHRDRVQSFLERQRAPLQNRAFSYFFPISIICTASSSCLTRNYYKAELFY